MHEDELLKAHPQCFHTVDYAAWLVALSESRFRLPAPDNMLDEINERLDVRRRCADKKDATLG
eukprot:6714813-Prorocentrum_lima.AAC.1